MEAYDILYPLVIRLPVISLRFQSVSKSWNDVISDKEFKKTHVDQSKALSPRNLLLVQTNDGVFEFRDFENPKIAMGKQEFPLKIRYRNPTILCLCNCLVLVKTHINSNEYALWNPCTNEYRTIVCPYLNGIMVPRGCGLCYDSGDDDYKVILIYKCLYALYHVKRNEWTKKIIVGSKVRARDLDMSRDCTRGISVDGYVFWSLGSKIDQAYPCSTKITYYDVKSDILNELVRPNFISGQWLYLTSLKGCVCLYGVKGGIMSFEVCELDIWIMEQGVWTQLMKINCTNSDIRDQYVINIVLLGCTKNGEILFQMGRRLERLIMYDPKRHKFVETVSISEDSKHDIIPICSESFYFPIET